MLYLDQQGGTDYDTMQDLPLPLGHRIDIAATETLSNNPIAMGFAALRNYGLNNDDTPKLDAASVTGLAKEYGIEGKALPGDQYNEAAARSIYERQRLTARAQAVDSQVNYSWSGTPLMALANTAAMLSDPLNLAAMFIPVVGEEYFAGRLAAQAGALGRFGVRATEGAVQGGIGMGVLEAASYPLHQALHDDYTATDSLVNMLAGAGIGAALHGLGGALVDKLRGIDLDKPLPPGIAREVDSPEVAQAKAKIALAQTIQGQPVDVLDTLFTRLRGQELSDRLARVAETLGVKVDEVNGGYSSRLGSVKIPQEDVLTMDKYTREEVFAHEMGHAVMQSRGMAFNHFPEERVREAIPNYDELVAASKDFRDTMWNDPVQRAHAAKPDEVMADAVASVLMGDKPLSLLRDMRLTASDIGMAAKELSPTAQRAASRADRRRARLGMEPEDVQQAPRIPEQVQPHVADARTALDANAQRSTALGDRPEVEPLARPEPIPKPGQSTEEFRAAEAQASAAEAEKNLADAIQNLKDSGYTVRAAPELAAADEAVAGARQEADAINRLSVCMERQ